jgi:hypothetical protein
LVRESLYVRAVETALRNFVFGASSCPRGGNARDEFNLLHVPPMSTVKHLFGFTEGADIGRSGEREAEKPKNHLGRFGKAAGSYAAVDRKLILVKVLPFREFLECPQNAALALFRHFRRARPRRSSARHLAGLLL